MATREGIAIKVQIGLRPNGHGDHPDWKLLPLTADGTPESDHQIVKWQYDKTSGHDDETADSPRGQQWGMMIVTQQLYDEAMAIPVLAAVITKMTEAEAETFWDVNAHGHIATNNMDPNALQALKVEYDIKVILSQDTTDVEARMAKAVDPNDPEPGMTKTPDKTWADAKVLRNFSIKKEVAEI